MPLVGTLTPALVPEGPEVRRHAAALDAALAGKPLVALEARTREARAWLEAHPGAFVGRRLDRVYSRGKWLVGVTDADGPPLYVASHLLMWGRWHVVPADDPLVLERDRRERARIVTEDRAGILLSAPIFVVGEGVPEEELEPLQRLGPDALPYEGPEAFDRAAFRERLFAVEQESRTLGAVLLDQAVVAGLGNYLRAEILFHCRMDPWRTVGSLEADELECLESSIAEITAYAYAHGGRTVPDEVQAHMAAEPEFRYGAEATPFNTRHWVFRRTNLPCLVCGNPVRQKKQVTHVRDDGEEKERIIYFCPTCQGTTINLPPVRKKSGGGEERKKGGGRAVVLPDISPYDVRGTDPPHA